MARIYIVEDEAIIRLYIESFLKKRYEVVGSTGSYKQALKEIIEKSPDLIISDVILLEKEGDGFSLMEAVNQKGFFPVVFLTSLPMASHNEKLSKIPVYGYVNKPIDEQRLVSAVEVALLRIASEKQLELFTEKLQSELQKREELENSLYKALQKHEDFLRQISDVVFEIDADGHLIEINQAIETFLGYTIEEAKEKQLTEFVSEDSFFLARELFQWFRSDVIQQKPFKETTLEIAFLHKNGIMKWGKMSVVPVFSPAGLFIGARGIVYDITREKQQQQRLEKHLQRLQQEKRYQAFIRYALERLNQTLDPYDQFPPLLDFLRLALNCDGMLLYRLVEGEQRMLKRLFCTCYANKTCKKLQEISLSDEEKRSLTSTIFWRRIADVPERFRFYWEEERVQRMLVVPFFVQERLLGCLVLFWQDVKILHRSLFTTAQIMAHIFAQGIARHEEWQQYVSSQKQLHEQKLLLEKAEGMLNFGQMMSAIAHEIRQPLQSIRILSESPIYWARSGKQLSYANLLSNMEKIVQRVQRIDSIIQSMRQAALSLQIIQPEKVSLHAAIEEALELVREDIVSAHIEVTKHLSPTEKCILFHPSQLVQVIVNILSNAIRILRKQSEPRKIFVETERVNDTLFLRIMDNGPGIPPEREKYIFEPFFTTHTGEGSGMGLYVVKRLLALYNASIVYRRKEMTIFEIAFPICHGEEG